MKARIVLFLALASALSLLFSSSVYSQETRGIRHINGANLYTRTIGEEDESIVVVHGGPGLAHNYLYPHFRELSDNYRLIFYDQRGCGLSDSLKEKDMPAMNVMVEDLECVRKAFGLDKMNLAGQSFGALIVLNYALKYPQNVKTIMLLEPAPGSTEYVMQFSKSIMERLSEGDKTQLMKILQSVNKSNASPEDFRHFMLMRFKTYYRDTLKLDPRSMDYFDAPRVKKFFRSAKALEPYFMNYNIYQQLPDIMCPVLIIRGEYDPVPKEAIEKMHAAIKNSEMHNIQECGHFAHIEKPGEYFGLIRKFLEKNGAI